MDKKCPFWDEERECSSNECGIENCDDEVPSGMKSRRPNRSDEVFIKVFFASGLRKFLGCGDGVIISLLLFLFIY